MSQPAAFIGLLGPAITDAYEETFDLTTLPPSHRTLGIYAPQATSITLHINAFTHTLTQSPTLLHSSLPGGTTGAVLWSITPHFARYLTSPALRPLLPASATVLELGCGVSAVLAATLGSTVAHYVQSDQPYAVKHAERNLRANLGVGRRGMTSGVIETIALDWEADDLASQPVLRALGAPLTAVVAGDCVFNEALVVPFLDTCVDACLLHRDTEREEKKTVVIVGMELRSPEVLECFLQEFMHRFDVWRIPPHLLPEELHPTLGFVIYVGTLKDGMSKSS